MSPQSSEALQQLVRNVPPCLDTPEDKSLEFHEHHRGVRDFGDITAALIPLSNSLTRFSLYEGALLAVHKDPLAKSASNIIQPARL